MIFCIIRTFVYLCVHMCMKEKENFSPDSSVLSKNEAQCLLTLKIPVTFSCWQCLPRSGTGTEYLVLGGWTVLGWGWFGLLGEEFGILGKCEGAGLGTTGVADQGKSPIIEAGCGEAEAEQDRRVGWDGEQSSWKGTHRGWLYVWLSLWHSWRVNKEIAFSL